VKPGAFFAVEGIEGSGKSTLARALADFLTSEGRNVLLTKEPGGTETGKHLRHILLNAPEPIDPAAETLLFLADRAQHVRELIRPSVKLGMIVLTDRYFYSTLAYQGFARGLALEELRQMNSFAIDGCLPNKVLLVDLPVETGLGRAKSRVAAGGEGWTRFEAESLRFHEKVRQGFLTLAAEDQARFAVLDGTLSQESLFEQAREIVQHCLGEVNRPQKGA